MTAGDNKLMDIVLKSSSGAEIEVVLNLLIDQRMFQWHHSCHRKQGFRMPSFIGVLKIAYDLQAIEHLLFSGCSKFDFAGNSAILPETADRIQSSAYA